MATLTGTEPQSARDTALAAEMAELTKEIDVLQRDLDRLYKKRLRTWQRAVKRGWTHWRIALASGAKEDNVTQQLRRARLGRR